MERPLAIFAFIGVVLLSWVSTKITATGILASDNITGSIASNSGCEIKGNINDKGNKVYHLKECSKYDDISINPSKGERWFCSEEEAEKEGFSESNNCP